MILKIVEKKLLYSTPRERRPLILDKVSQVLEEIEKEGEVCGYIFFGFVTKDGEVQTSCDYEGLTSPIHVAEALASFGILHKVTT